MKKIELLSFLALILFASCGERYEEVRGSTFEGTWTLLESYVDTKPVAINSGKFFTAREFEGENLLLFYTGGQYDSSFFFRIQDNNLFVRRVLDSVEVRYPYYMEDSTGNKILMYDTIKKIQKPLSPQTGYSPEKYYGTISFGTGAELTLTINRYLVNENGAPTGNLYGSDIYSRPLEKE
jgi:hypothetical protein